MAGILPFISTTAPPQNYNTQLPLLDELAFRQWVQSNRVPFNPDAQSSDYDMRGFWQGLQQQHPRANTAINPNDNQLHFPGIR